MQPALTAGALVSTWEDGSRRLPVDRALLMLWAAGFDGDLADLSIAERDRKLLAVHSATFGEAIVTLADCPECDATVELEFGSDALTEAVVNIDVVEVEVDGAPVTLRPLSSRDLADAAQVDADEVEAFLLSRLTEGAVLSDEQQRQITALIESRESDTEVRLPLRCAECSTEWSEVFDPVEHLWSKVAEAAGRVLAEVAEIAAAFGWSEAEILAMSGPRRATYLAIVRQG